MLLAANNYPDWLNKAAFYQIYPQSFKDSNGDGIGDLNGISQKLDYLSDLGVTAIWLNPIFDSRFKDAGYDVSDFYKIAPRYGNKSDLVKLIQKAHSKDIKVVLDLVAGHTSDQHKWFKKSASGKKNIFTDFYIWTKSKNVRPENYVTGVYDRDASYLKNFFDCQPALNYGFAVTNNAWEQALGATGPTAVKNEMIKIIDYWMQLGVDGFRVDMASSLIKNDSNFIHTKQLWKEIRNWFSTKYPQGVLIAEWSNPKQSVEAGFMIDFMMHFNVPGYPSLFFNNGGVFKKEKCYFDANASGEPFEFITNYTEQVQAVTNRGFVSVPTGNHDINRLNSGSRNTDEQLKTALFFLLTLKGIPFIYYGDEIGIPYTENLADKEGSVLVNFGNENRAGSRTPMQWNVSANAGFSTSSKNQLYLPVNNSYISRNVSQQLEDKNSILNFVKQLLKLRTDITALGNTGNILFLNQKGQNYPLCYKRMDKTSVYLLVTNPTNNIQTIEIEFTGNSINNIIANKIKTELKNKTIKVETGAFGYGIFKLL